VSWQRIHYIVKDQYEAVHATDLLTPREKMFIGLAVTLTRTCEP
jgi:hypothetical protein